MTSLTAIERFENKYIPEPNSGCWLWTAGCFSTGLHYGQFSIRGEHTTAHRAAWRLLKGEIPVGMLVCHTCDNPQCVNPSHLFLGTSLDNNRDKCRKGRHANQRKEYCPSGHRYSLDNTYQYATGRHCKQCMVIRNKAKRGASRVN